MNNLKLHYLTKTGKSAQEHLDELVLANETNSEWLTDQEIYLYRRGIVIVVGVYDEGSDYPECTESIVAWDTQSYHGEGGAKLVPTQELSTYLFLRWPIPLRVADRYKHANTLGFRRDGTFGRW